MRREDGTCKCLLLKCLSIILLCCADADKSRIVGLSRGFLYPLDEYILFGLLSRGVLRRHQRAPMVCEILKVVSYADRWYGKLRRRLQAASKVLLV